MNKKPSKKSTPTPRYDSGRETRVLLEQLRSEMKTIGEKYSGLVNKIDKMDQEIRSHGSVLFKLEFGMQKIESRTGTIDTKVDRIEKELETVKAAIKDVDSRIGEKVEDHEHHVQKLEAVR